MILEARQLLGQKISLPNERPIGSLDRIIFSHVKMAIVAFRVKTPGILRPNIVVLFDDIVKIGYGKIVVDSDYDSSGERVAKIEEIFRQTGSVIGVSAKTENGNRIGRVADLDFFAESGKINRFYLRNILNERIISVEYVIALTPKAVIFKDIVNQPIFDRLAAEAIRSR